jgi:DNA-binding CsgD family transcriptional regulator
MEDMMGTFESLTTGSPAFVVGAAQRVSSWNAAMVELTGIPASDAIGQPCHEVMSEVGDLNAARCRRDCAVLRQVRAGWSARSTPLLLTRDGKRRPAELLTISAPGEPGGVLHLVAPTGPAVEDDPAVVDSSITPRQRDVLTLLAAGSSVSSIAERLVLSESTVRNHVRAILIAFGVHSMLQAVVEGRSRGLVA